METQLSLLRYFEIGLLFGLNTISEDQKKELRREANKILNELRFSPSFDFYRNNLKHWSEEIERKKRKLSENIGRTEKIKNEIHESIKRAREFSFKSKKTV